MIGAKVLVGFCCQHRYVSSMEGHQIAGAESDGRAKKPRFYLCQLDQLDYDCLEPHRHVFLCLFSFVTLSQWLFVVVGLGPGGLGFETGFSPFS